MTVGSHENVQPGQYIPRAGEQSHVTTKQEVPADN